MEKNKAGVFIGPHISNLFRDLQFHLFLSDDEKVAWNALRYTATGFLGNVKAVNFRNLVKDLIPSYEKLGCSMSLMMHFLHSHLDFFLVIIIVVP
jgi:hypothetical protein